MENQEKTTLDRVLKEQHFKNAEEAIKGGKENGNLTNVELVENLVESYKGKTVEAPIEVIIISAIFLDAGEIIGTIEALKHILNNKMIEELKAKAKHNRECDWVLCCGGYNSYLNQNKMSNNY